jgi:hypothetical protein
LTYKVVILNAKEAKLKGLASARLVFTKATTNVVRSSVKQMKQQEERISKL